MKQKKKEKAAAVLTGSSGGGGGGASAASGANGPQTTNSGQTIQTHLAGTPNSHASDPLGSSTGSMMTPLDQQQQQQAVVGSSPPQHHQHHLMDLNTTTNSQYSGQDSLGIEMQTSFIKQ